MHSIKKPVQQVHVHTLPFIAPSRSHEHRRHFGPLYGKSTWRVASRSGSWPNQSLSFLKKVKSGVYSTLTFQLRHVVLRIEVRACARFPPGWWRNCMPPERCQGWGRYCVTSQKWEPVLISPDWILLLRIDKEIAKDRWSQNDSTTFIWSSKYSQSCKYFLVGSPLFIFP